MTEIVLQADEVQKIKEQVDAMHQYKKTVTLQRQMAAKRQAHEQLNKLLFQYSFE